MRSSLNLIANQAEPTVALLRYAFGGYRPSKTDRLPGSPARFKMAGPGLGVPMAKGGVSLAAPPAPKGGLQRLPLTLSMTIEKPVTAYSKGA
jgi:hypothetical protein